LLGKINIFKMASEIATLEQIAEYESQLAGINELLAASPGDESLLELKRDMEELLALSKASLEGQQQQEESGSTTTEPNTEAAAATAAPGSSESSSLDDLQLPLRTSHDGQQSSSAAAADFNTDSGVDSVNAELALAEAMQNGAAQAAAASLDEPPNDDGNKKSKKKEKVKDFVLPPHLVPNEGDSEAERNRKRRAAKALKNKWRQRMKEVESTNKQKSWQSFQKKTKRKGDEGESIFATKDGVSDRVGVVSKKQMTEFGSRKRHKHL
jgi:survival of motor neuron-related-splicing factor 30